MIEGVCGNLGGGSNSISTTTNNTNKFGFNPYNFTSRYGSWQSTAITSPVSATENLISGPINKFIQKGIENYKYPSNIGKGMVKKHIASESAEWTSKVVSATKALKYGGAALTAGLEILPDLYKDISTNVGWKRTVANLSVNSVLAGIGIAASVTVSFLADTITINNQSAKQHYKDKVFGFLDRKFD